MIPIISCLSSDAFQTESSRHTLFNFPATLALDEIIRKAPTEARVESQAGKFQIVHNDYDLFLSL